MQRIAGGAVLAIIAGGVVPMMVIRSLSHPCAALIISSSLVKNPALVLDMLLQACYGTSTHSNSPCCAPNDMPL
jgi:hypothetical protein